MTLEQNSQSQWQQEIQDDLMREAGVDDEFSKFLDLGDGFPQFSDFDPSRSGLDTPMGQLGFGQNDVFQQAPDMSIPGAFDQAGPGSHTPLTNPRYDLYQQYRGMGMPQYHVPPTPLTSEMQAAKYGQRLDSSGRLVMDGLQTSFTPLVSPAQTPTFGLLDYDEFFSPLTSPAIEAQTAYHTGSTASPIEMGIDALAPSKTSAPSSRKSRRKPSLTTRTPRSVKQSPAMKPQRAKRRPSLNNLSIDEVGGMLQQASHGLGLQSSTTALRSSDDSLSPESLSETAMRPPPLPSSRSPLVTGGTSAAPVTPATLMRMPSNKQISLTVPVTDSSVTGGMMEDIMLPDAAAPGQAENDTSQPQSDQSTPTMSGKLSTANTPHARGASQESFIKPKLESKLSGRGQKKRPTPASANISPAIRPKISPSISPLVPIPGPGMSMMSAETSALYLASKSNYQNILDGTHLPGVSYPETLVENLSQKRTSHKLAEQGRRNRINVALKEIESLLPASITAPVAKKEKSSPSGNDDDKAGANGPGASKASTVEMAITYIKSLQEELQSTQAELKTTKKQLDVAGKTLAALRGEGNEEKEE